MPLEAGLQATVTATVGDQDTAIAVGSGDVPVLATPRVLALAERAAVEAVRDALPAGRTSVGTWAEVFHNAPTRLGEQVAITATLTAVEGKRLEFSISVQGGNAEVATVAHRRAIVDPARFS